MKIIREHIIVKVPSVFIDESKYKGVDGKTIILNVLYQPERHIRDFGIVTSVPDELFKYPLMNEHVGKPAYHEHPYWGWKTNEDIELDIKIGDKVYFHYNCLLPDQQGGSAWNKMFMFSKKEVENGKTVEYHYFRVKYDLVFAAVRYEKINNVTRDFEWWMEKEVKPFECAIKPEGMQATEKLYQFTDLSGAMNAYKKEVVMIGSYVFIEPDVETWEDISIAIPETINGKVLLNPDGSKKMKPKDQWLVTKSIPDERYLCGWVRYVGSALKGDSTFLEPGEYVYFQRFANTKVAFEGFNYFRMRQRHVIATDKSKNKLYA